MKRTLASVCAVLALALAAIAQSTNAAQFQVSMNFLGGQPYSQSSALSTAFSTQFTTNVALRADIVAMPGAGYTGYFGGPQYNLCGIAAIESWLSTTSISCGKISPYLQAAIGLGRIQQSTTSEGVAGLGRVGMNYDPTGSGVFTLNLFEAGWGHFGPSIATQTNNGWFYQTGISVGLGSSSSATQAKKARMAHAAAAKLKKLNAAIQKAQKG